MIKKSIQLTVCFLISIFFITSCATFGENYYFNRGNLKFSQDKFNLAIKYYSWAIRDNPQNVEAFLGRGASWLMKSDYQAAIDDFTTAINLRPNYSEAYFNRATAWIGKGDVDRALVDCNTGIDIANRNNESYIQYDEKVYILKSNIKYIKGDYTKVAFNLLKVIELNPQNHKAYNNYAWLLATCPNEKYRNGNQAISFAQKAINIKHLPDYFDTLAAAYAEAGNFLHAIKIQEKAINLIGEKKNEMLTNFKQHLQLYKLRKPMRSETAKNIRPGVTP